MAGKKTFSFICVAYTCGLKLGLEELNTYTYINVSKVNTSNLTCTRDDCNNNNDVDFFFIYAAVCTRRRTVQRSAKMFQGWSQWPGPVFHGVSRSLVRPRATRTSLSDKRKTELNESMKLYMYLVYTNNGPSATVAMLSQMTAMTERPIVG